MRPPPGVTPLRSAPRLSTRRRALAYSDPLAHGLVAAAVVLPLVPRFGRRPLLSAVAAALAIDLDHPVAARSLRLAPMVSMQARPPTHNLLSALAAGGVGAVAGGAVHGWAAFAGLSSHLLYDSADSAAPTPLLWPLRPPRQLGCARAGAGLAALTVGSWLLSRAESGATGPAAAAPGGGGGSTPPRTA